MRRPKIQNLEIERFLEKELSMRVDLHRYFDLSGRYNRPAQKIAAREFAILREIQYRLLGSYRGPTLTKAKPAAGERGPGQLPLEDPEGGRP